MSSGSGTTLLDGYRPDSTVLDELVEGAALRPHWEHVSSALDTLGLDELRRRQEEVRRLLEADGATYRLRDIDRTQSWKLDAVPLLVSSADWSGIEAGVAQRAVLLDLVLRDLHGEQQLLRRGVIPPEVVFADPAYLLPAHGIGLPDGRQLFTYAVDLGRNDEGVFTVVADHAQAPSGSGYALENRVVLSRVFASLYRSAGVHRVAPFFRALRAGLEALGEHRSEYPRIVVLSPGPRSETAFEHGYIASYLGYSLVEGSDLVVTDGAVFLRALGGLEPVDVILRRVDAAYADPLELRGDSRLGVPGLVEACRRGSVVVVNPFGSGTIENPVLNAFLPAASRALLGEELQLDAVPTWWCGDPASLLTVLDDLRHLTVAPIPGGAPAGTAVAHDGSMMADSELDELRARISAAPERWYARRMLPLSTSPTLTAEGLGPRRTLIRTYAVAEDDSYHVMAGGLTRVAPDDASTVISNQAGAVAKDTWVLAGEPEQASLWWRRPGSAEPTGDPFAGLSERAAENLFWVGRYAERAESVVRLLRAVHNRRFDPGPADEAAQQAVEVLMGALAAATFAGPDRPLPAGDLDDELASLTGDVGRPGSLAFAVSRLLASAEAIRDQLSTDTWQVTGVLERNLVTLATTSPNRLDLGQGTLDAVMQSLLALHGVAGESMIRDPGWYFMDAGRRIERFLHLAVVLRSGLAQPRDPTTDGLVLESLLVSAESIVTYRRRFRSRVGVDTLLDLLVVDPGNPRSLRYQLDRLAEALDALSAVGTSEVAVVAEPIAHLNTLTAIVDDVDTDALAVVGGGGERSALAALLGDVVAEMASLADALARSNFTEHPPPQPLGQQGPSV